MWASTPTNGFGCSSVIAQLSKGRTRRVAPSFSQIFRDLTVDHIVEGGQTMNPSIEDILDAINKVNAKCVFVFPNNGNVILAAQQAAELSSKEVHVIPTKNVAMGIAAAVAFQPDMNGEENAQRMAEAAQRVKTGTVTYAVRDSEWNGVHISAGDIIGLHNHGTIQIGDTFTQGEMMKFTGIPNFAPELFRRIRLKDPLKQKQLLKGLVQLSEEGAVQVFRPIANNDLIVGAVGVLQFDVVVARLKSEYNVEAIYESVNVATARWVESTDVKKFEEFKRKNEVQLALDGGDNLTYIAPTMVNLNLTQERYPDVVFRKTREH